MYTLIKLAIAFFIPVQTGKILYACPFGVT